MPKKNKKTFQIGDENDFYQWKVASLARWTKDGIKAGGFKSPTIKEDDGRTPNCLEQDAPRHVKAVNDRELADSNLRNNSAAALDVNANFDDPTESAENKDYRIKISGRDPLSVLPESPPKFLTKGIPIYGNNDPYYEIRNKTNDNKND